MEKNSALKKLALALALLAAAAAARAEALRVVSGLVNPESALIGWDGRVYVSQIGEFGKDGDGSIAVIGKGGKLELFAKGLDDPKGLAVLNKNLYVTDKNRIWKIDSTGKARVFVKLEAFPQPPLFLNDLVFDSRGNLYVSDTGDIEKGGKGALFRVNHLGKVSLVINEAQEPRIKSPNGLLMDGPDKLLVVDFASGELNRLNLKTKKLEKVADGFGGGDGLVRDKAGVLYVSDWKGGHVWRLNLKQKDAKPQQFEQTFQASADIGLDRTGKFLLVPDMKAGTVTWLPK